MLYCEQIFDDPAANLAFEEDWLESADLGRSGELLRVWEAPRPMVVIGRSSRASEVRLDQCRRLGVPVLRRCSGGAAIVAGPGCLLYAVVLDCRRQPELKMIDRAHAFVLERVLQALSRTVPRHGATRQGLSDLAVGDRKISGNSLRCKRDFLLYHGTILYDFQLTMIQTLLNQPPRQPDYRGRRSHADFVSNISLNPREMTANLQHVWRADEHGEPWSFDELPSLRRYESSEWRLA